jgi:aspartate/tyrosine/aromatic aminotransferase
MAPYLSCMHARTTRQASILRQSRWEYRKKEVNCTHNPPRRPSIISDAPGVSGFVVHACAHNPSGVDPMAEQVGL